MLRPVFSGTDPLQTRDAELTVAAQALFVGFNSLILAGFTAFASERCGSRWSSSAAAASFAVSQVTLLLSLLVCGPPDAREPTMRFLYSCRNLEAGFVPVQQVVSTVTLPVVLVYAFHVRWRHAAIVLFVNAVVFTAAMVAVGPPEGLVGSGLSWMLFVFLTVEARAQEIRERARFTLVLTLKDRARERDQAQARIAHAAQLIRKEQDERVRAESRRGTQEALLGYICHEILNPLQAIFGTLSVICSQHGMSSIGGLVIDGSESRSKRGMSTTSSGSRPRAGSGRRKSRIKSRDIVAAAARHTRSSAEGDADASGGGGSSVGASESPPAGLTVAVRRAARTGSRGSRRMSSPGGAIGLRERAALAATGIDARDASPDADDGDTYITVDRDDLAAIEDAASQMQLFTNDVLDHIALSRGTLQVRMAPCSIREVVESVAKDFSHVHSAGVLATIDADVPPLITSDAQRIRQVVVHGVANGVRFSLPGEPVLILVSMVQRPLLMATSPTSSGASGRTENTDFFDALTPRAEGTPTHRDSEAAGYRPPEVSAPRRCLHVEVVNRGTGLGLAEGESARSLFYPAVDIGHTSIGLPICRMLISLLEGDIGLRDGPDGATAFWFDIPLDVPAKETVPPLSPTSRLALEPTGAGRGIVRHVARLSSGGAGGSSALGVYMGAISGSGSGASSGRSETSARGSAASPTASIAVSASPPARGTFDPSSDERSRGTSLSSAGGSSGMEGGDSAMSLTEARAPRVLFCDDERTLRRVAQRMLKLIGCEYGVVEDGDEVLGALREAVAAGKPYDIVLLDINMVRTNGVAVCRDLRENHHVSIPIIPATGNASASDRSRYSAAGFTDDILAKPYSVNELRACIAKNCPFLKLHNP